MDELKELASRIRELREVCEYTQEELAKEYLRLFCKMSDTALQYVQNWMPIVAASQSVKENSEDDFELLSRWVNVVDYV